MGNFFGVVGRVVHKWMSRQKEEDFEADEGSGDL